MLLALEKYQFKVDFTEKLSIMNSHISYIQQKFMDRKIYRDAKLEVLKLYWTQVLGWFVRKGCELMDK